MKHMVCRAGLIGNRYDDVVREMNPAGVGTYQMFMAEYGDVFLDSQFGDDADGMLYKFEGVRVVVAAESRRRVGEDEGRSRLGP